MGPQTYFVTTLDLIKEGDDLIRQGAVGIWNRDTNRVAFRPRDYCNNRLTNATYDDGFVTRHQSKLQIEPGT